MASPNHFQELLNDLKNCSNQAQWQNTLLSGIIQQMQETNNTNTVQLAQELKQLQPQIVQTSQQAQAA